MKARKIVAAVSNAKKNSDLRADDPAILAAFDREFESLRSRICPYCNGTGVEKSGVCHCGECMDAEGVFAHDGHSPVEMERQCEACSEAVERRGAIRWLKSFVVGLKGDGTPHPICDALLGIFEKHIAELEADRG